MTRILVTVNGVSTKTCCSVLEEFTRSDRAIINRLHTNIVHISTLACGQMYCAGIFLHNDILCVGICKLEDIVKVTYFRLFYTLCPWFYVNKTEKLVTLLHKNEYYSLSRPS